MDEGRSRSRIFIALIVIILGILTLRLGKLQIVERSNHTGQSAEKVEKDCDRNLWLDATEAIEYGLADRVLQKAPEIVRDQESKEQ